MLTLDRVELADIFNPEKLVQAIYEQKPDMPIPVPIEDLVIANDIKKIEKLVGAPEFVGMLATDESKNIGQIWVGTCALQGNGLQLHMSSVIFYFLIIRK
jgi:hypothetical protein